MLIEGLLWLACSSPEEAPLSLHERAGLVTFESVTQLGPHQLETSSVVQPLGADEREENLELRWGNWDNFQWREIKESRLIREVRVVEGQAFLKTRDGAFKSRPDAELYRVQIAQSWNRWGLALEPFSAWVEYREVEELIVEGRKAARYQLLLRDQLPEEEEVAKQGKKKRKRRVLRQTPKPLSLEGSVLYDRESGVRLMGEFEGQLATAEGVPLKKIRYKETRSGLGEYPVIDQPGLETP